MGGRLSRIAAGIILVVIVVTAFAWLATHDVSDAQARVEALAAKHHVPVLSPADVPPPLALAAVATADERSYPHHGADLPRIVRAGRHIARSRRYIRNFAHEVEPEDVVAYVRAEARRGDGWVKLVGDWIDRETGDLSPSFPRETGIAAVQAAHEEGARTPAGRRPCQTRIPPRLSTRAKSLMTVASSRGCAKKPNEVNRSTTASNYPAHLAGSFLMSPCV